MKTICLLAFLAFSTAVFAQQLPLFGQWRENRALINPASISSNYLNFNQKMELGATSRRQWTSISDGPLTHTARGELIFPEARTVVGANLLADRTGPTGQTGGQIRYAFLLRDGNKDGDDTWISLGGAVGGYQNFYRGDEILFRDAGDLTGTQVIKTGKIDAGAGFFLAKKIGYDFLYAGGSVMNFQVFSDQKALKLRPHFSANVGWIKINKNEGYFEPAALVRWVPSAPVLVEAVARLHTAQNFWVGAGQSFSISSAGDQKALKTNNLLFEIGLTLDEDLGGFDDGSLRLGLCFQPSYTRFGPNLGSALEFNATYARK